MKTGESVVGRSQTVFIKHFYIRGSVQHGDHIQQCSCLIRLPRKSITVASTLSPFCINVFDSANISRYTFNFV